MVTSAVQTPILVGTGSTDGGGEDGRSSLGCALAAPGNFSVMIEVVRLAAFLAAMSLRLAATSSVPPPPTACAEGGARRGVRWRDAHYQTEEVEGATMEGFPPRTGL